LGYGVERRTAGGDAAGAIAGILMNYLPTAALALLLAPAMAMAQDAKVQATILSLAQPAQTNIDFTEVRFSPMLKEPIIISGVLGYLGPAALDRHVLLPYREDTEIRKDAVRITREGEPERTFALRRAPELQQLLDVFSAILAGDHATIYRDFTVNASYHDQVWQLDLIPRAANIRKRVSEIRIDGHDSLPTCFWISRDETSFSVMLLDAAARTELPQPLTRAWLQTECST
jgi:hypothetical protein